MINLVGMWTSFRSTLDSYISVVGARFAMLVWVGAIAALIWIFGPRLVIGDFAPLAPPRNRLIAIGALFLLWGIWALISWLRARRADARMIDEIADSPEARAQAETKAEIDELRKRLREAMAMMRKVVRRRYGYVYEFPWYLMMGAPGAGKTTLLTNSGLKFPLGDALGGEPVQGVGGTRNCNWWFTDRAILIDTAGRYTTQDSGHERDKAGFAGFLKMLRQRRRAQPINGVILTMALTDILGQSPEDRLREVRAIRQRLAEMATTLEARVPVYIVLTKVDRVAGFEQFFERLGAEARGQVWGLTLPYEETRSGAEVPAVFSREYHRLAERLNEQLLDRLQQESDLNRRGRVFRFPAQIAALHDSLLEVIEELSSGTGTIEKPLLRGVYFASATQEAEFRHELGGARSMNRSYFVDRLFGDVILNEAGLVVDDRRISRRRRIVTGAIYATLAVATAFLSGSWLSAYLVNRGAINQVETQLARYDDLAMAIPVRDVSDTDFLRILPALDALTNVPAAFEVQDGNAPLGVPLHRAALGLDREDDIVIPFEDQYSRALGAYLLPRYMVALQNRLKQPDLDPGDAFETLKHYLSLAGMGPIDPDALLAQSEEIFAVLYPGSGRDATRQRLQEHMEAMLAKGQLPVMAIDDALVASTREKIKGLSPAQRTYDMLLTRRAARELTMWTPAEALGPAGSRVFARASGAELSDGIAGIFSRRGYQQVVLTQISALSEIAASEGWVRGARDAEGTSQNASDIAADAVNLYWSEFSRHWNDLLSDLVIRDIGDLRAASDLVAVVASESRPLERLAQGIARETWLTAPPGSTELAAAATEVASEAALAAGNLAFDPLAAPDPYAALRRGLQPEGEEKTTMLTPLEPLFENIYQQISRAAASDARTAEIFAADGALTTATQDLLAQGQRLPRPVDQWVVGIAGRIGEAAVAGAQKSLNDLWKAEGYAECRRAIEGRYPFAPDTAQDVTIADFTRIFGPNGVFKSFFDENLTGLVDVSVDPWRWTGGLGTTGQTSDGLRQFQRAATIRTAFFPPDGSGPKVDYSFDLLSMENAEVALIEVGGKSSYHGQDNTRERSFVWPTEEREVVLLTLLPGSRSEAIKATGPWAPFRLMDHGQVSPVSENEFDVFFRTGDRAATLRVTSGSVNNPFNLDALHGFACPEAL
ncbi:type VI secretion system membrane subunit TssM [Paracoccus sp. (in: a-proteobacteria)]|uniref:type VI secretion system membrane subunit TssM n=1 Tax=Paracoccus sp. TaxID=267 RepID=UPI003A888DFB